MSSEQNTDSDLAPVSGRSNDATAAELGATWDETDPRQRLVMSTIRQIEERGLGRATVRSIASDAGMNVASINYYFGSKAVLIGLALDGAINHMIADGTRILDTPAQSHQAVLTELLTYYFEGARSYPNTTRAHLRPAFESDDYSGAFFEKFGSVIERLRELLVADGVADEVAGRRVIAALSAVFFPVLFGGLFAPAGGLETVRARREYVKGVVAAALMR